MPTPVLVLLIAVAIVAAVYAYRRFAAQPEEKPRKRRNPDQMFKM